MFWGLQYQFIDTSIACFPKMNIGCINMVTPALHEAGDFCDWTEWTRCWQAMSGLSQSAQSCRCMTFWNITYSVTFTLLTSNTLIQYQWRNNSFRTRMPWLKYKLNAMLHEFCPLHFASYQVTFATCIKQRIPSYITSATWMWDCWHQHDGIHISVLFFLWNIASTWRMKKNVIHQNFCT